MPGQDVSTVSVVVASGAGGEFLARCLDSLRQQARERGAEVIVVDRRGPAVRERLGREFPWVQVIDGFVATERRRPSVPELRAVGVRRAAAPIVAILEEHCVAPPTWLQTIQESFCSGDAAIGGPILDANYRRLSDWVVYFSEYHNYLPPWQEGERYLLNGANVAYDRALLLRHADLLSSGYWEVVLHPVLAREGRFRSVPSMGVYHTGPFGYRYYLEQRYLLSRVWGGTQRQASSPLKRWAYALGAPAFPALLLARMGNRVFRSGRRMPQFLAALPLLVPATIAYVYGEWSGYVSGTGDALERVE